MIGSLAAVTLPESSGRLATTPLESDPLQTVLFETHRIEVPLWSWPGPPRRHLRIAAQIYNDRAQFERLAAALSSELRRA
jgi:isopenicillin-N epimerase